MSPSFGSPRAFKPSRIMGGQPELNGFWIFFICGLQKGTHLCPFTFSDVCVWLVGYLLKVLRSVIRCTQMPINGMEDLKFSYRSYGFFLIVVKEIDLRVVVIHQELLNLSVTPFIIPSPHTIMHWNLIIE